MFISVCAFSLMDVLVKWSDAYPVGQVLFFRGFFGIIPLLFLIPRDRFLDFYKTSRPFLHFKRCLSGLIALISIFIALRNLPLATVVSITFAAPIFTTVFSIFIGNRSLANLSQLASAAILRGYGREAELEADKVGAEYIAKLGYNPDALKNVIGVLKNQEEFDKVYKK